MGDLTLYSKDFAFKHFDILKFQKRIWLCGHVRGVKATGGILGLVLVTGCPVIDCQVSCQAGGHWSELSGQSTWSPLRLSVGSSRRILPGAETHNRGSSIPRSPCPPFLISFPESLFTRSSTTQRLATVLFSGAQIKAAVLSRVNIFDQQTQSPKRFYVNFARLRERHSSGLW